MPKVANRGDPEKELANLWDLKNVGVFLSFFIRFWGATS
jgi:hypothetical protein